MNVSSSFSIYKKNRSIYCTVVNENLSQYERGYESCYDMVMNGCFSGLFFLIPQEEEKEHKTRIHTLVFNCVI